MIAKSLAVLVRGVSEVSPLGECIYIASKHWNIFNDKEYASW